MVVRSWRPKISTTRRGMGKCPADALGLAASARAAELCMPAVVWTAWGVYPRLVSRGDASYGSVPI